jgi:hypothetical protein
MANGEVTALIPCRRIHLLHEVTRENSAAVAQQIARSALPRERFRFSIDCAVRAKYRIPPTLLASTRNTYETSKRIIGSVKKWTDTTMLSCVSRNVLYLDPNYQSKQVADSMQLR